MAQMTTGARRQARRLTVVLFFGNHLHASGRAKGGGPGAANSKVAQPEAGLPAPIAALENEGGAFCNSHHILAGAAIHAALVVPGR